MDEVIRNLMSHSPPECGTGFLQTNESGVASDILHDFTIPPPSPFAGNVSTISADLQSPGDLDMLDLDMDNNPNSELRCD